MGVFTEAELNLSDLDTRVNQNVTDINALDTKVIKFDDRITVLEEKSTDVNYAELAESIDFDQLASEVCDKIDIGDITDSVADNVRDNLDLSDIANSLDMSDLAGYCDNKDIADNLDLEQLAEYVNLAQLAEHVNLKNDKPDNTLSGDAVKLVVEVAELKKQVETLQTALNNAAPALKLVETVVNAVRAFSVVR